MYQDKTRNGPIIHLFVEPAELVDVTLSGVLDMLRRKKDSL